MELISGIRRNVRVQRIVDSRSVKDVITEHKSRSPAPPPADAIDEPFEGSRSAIDEAKVVGIRQAIEDGTLEIDYDQLAIKVLSSEMVLFRTD